MQVSNGGLQHLNVRLELVEQTPSPALPALGDLAVVHPVGAAVTCEGVKRTAIELAWRYGPRICPHVHSWWDFFIFICSRPDQTSTCSVKRVVVQGDGTEGKLHGSTSYPLIDCYTEGESSIHSLDQTKYVYWCAKVRPAFVFSMDVIADVQVQVFDLEVMRGLAHVVGAEQPGHGCAGVGCCGCLLGSRLLR